MFKLFNIKNKNKKRRKNKSKKLLLDLKRHGTILMISSAKNEFTGTILDVLSDSDKFLFELVDEKGKNPHSSELEELTFFGELHSQYIEFKCANIEEQKMQSLPVFAAIIPEQISITQRRGDYRFKLSEAAGYFCSGKLADGSDFKFKIADISNGGVGLYFDRKELFSIKTDEMIRDAVLDFKGFGKHSFDLKYIQTMQRKTFNRNATTTSKSILSFQFENMPLGKERELARLMRELQQDEAVKSDRFRRFI